MVPKYPLFRGSTVDIKCGLFDISLVTPILMYGCEVWGTKRHARDSLEKTLVKFCKLVLGVPSSVTTDVVLGELNWYIPIVDKYIHSFVQCSIGSGAL